jgi:hypothetical protein
MIWGQNSTAYCPVKVSRENRKDEPTLVALNNMD